MRRQPETAGAAFVCLVHLPDAGTRRRSSSKKFNRNVRCVIGFGSAVPTAFGTTVKRLPSGARS
jgi:hypothetical protein